MLIREAQISDADAIGRVLVETQRAQYRGLLSDGYLAGLSVEGQAQRWARRLSDATSQAFAYIAETDDGQVVGFAGGGPERDRDPVYTGELYAIYILPTHQGHGAGHHLMRATAERLALMGLHSMLVWVFAANPACGFYEALGGKPVRTQALDIGGTFYEAIAYGWLDMSVLTS